MKQKHNHRAKRLAGLLLALALTASLVGGTGLPAWTAAETALAAEAATLSGGETITEGGTYSLADGATGTVTISTTEAVVIEGSGVSWDDDYVMDCTEYEDLHFDCAEGADLTLKDAFITNNGTETASLVDFTGSGNRLSIEGTVVLENSGLLYALLHVGEGTSLTIAGTGTLYLYKYNQAAGIGGDAGELNGDITFGDDDSSLTVFAKGSKQGALIGAGADAASEEEDPGSISFVEGTYNLVSVSRGAVIGGSAGSGGASDGTTVYVGTKVNMNINVDYSGAAVGGGGYDGGNDSSGGTLYVTGGSLRCYIDTNAAGNTTGWNGQSYTEGVNDAAITAQRLNGDGEAVYWSSFNTGLLDEEAKYFEVYVDGELFYEGGLPEYGFVQEGLDKSEQLSITSTVSNWYKNGETNLYFYLTGENHTVVVNGEEFSCTWDSDAEGFTFAEVVAAMYDVTQNLENITASGDTTVRDGKKYKTTLAAADGYVLPEAITVSVAGTELTAGTGYSYSNITGELVIYSAYTTGAVTITASAVADTFAASLTVGDTISYYGTVEEAFAYANTIGTSCTVSLRTDCTVTESLAAGSGSEITLDLAGYALVAGEGSSISVLTVNGSLTVADSSGDATGTVTGGSGTLIDSVSYGGGIYVLSGGSLTVTGGCVTGNTADYGGGIYAAGSVSLSGVPVITGNTSAGDTGGAEDNLYLPSGNTATLVGSLEEGAQVCVTAADVPSDGVTVPVTAAEADTSYYKKSVDYVTSDAGYYVMADTDAGCLVLSVQEGREASVEDESGAVSYYGTVEEAFAYVNTLESSCTVTLLSDCDISESLTLDAGHTAMLDLGGHTLAAEDGTSISVLTVNGTMTMDDSSEDGDGMVTGGTGIVVDSYVYGGGVYVTESGSLTMAGGNITGNTLTAYYDSSLSRNEGKGYGAYGGGVCALGSFTMDGGSISGNAVNGTYDNDLAGGGVYAACGFTMTGGSIDGNTLSGSTYGYGGGMFAGSSSTLSGGSISNNVLSLVGADRTKGYGGGLCCQDGSLKMTGGTVSGNTLSCEAGYGMCIGGGISVRSFYLYGGEISGNTIKSSQYSYGGGVGGYSNTSSKVTIYMYGGTITGNYISASGTYASGAEGGGICARSMSAKVVINGGKLTGNPSGAGVSVYSGSSSAASLWISGSEIGSSTTTSVSYTEDIDTGGYGIATSLTGLSLIGSVTALTGEDYTVEISAADGYALPHSLTLTYPADGDCELTDGEDYSYDAESGALTIYASAVTGPVIVSGTGSLLYDVSWVLTELSAEGAEYAADSWDYTAALSPDEGVTLPDFISVSVGGSELAVDEDYSYDADSGVLTIYGEAVTGDVTVTAVGVMETVLETDADGYYLISSADDIILFAQMVNYGYVGSCARLMSDVTVTPDTGFEGIGTLVNPYTGTFDGNGHTVTLSLSTDSAAGFFAFVSGAMVGNLTVAGTVETTVNTYGCAGLVSYVTEGGVTIDSCVNKADVTGVGYVGGLVGRTAGSASDLVDVTVTDSINEGDITSTGNYAGGIAASIYSGSITDSANEGDITSTVNYAGGIAASVNSGSITGCMNAGTVTGTGYKGGIVGYAYCSTESLVVSQCGNDGAVTGSGNYTGGVAGYARCGSSGALSMDSLYNAGAVTGNSYTGGVIGRSNVGISNAYNVGAVTGTASSTGGIIGNNFGSGKVLSNAYNAGEVACISSDVTCAGGLLVGSITSSSYVMYADNTYYLGTLDGSAIASGSSYFYSCSTQAALTDDELAAMAKTSEELAALADTLGGSFVANMDSGYHLGYPVLAWEVTGDDPEELQIITQPEDYTGTAGSTAVFEVEVTGSGLTYQWQYLNAGASTWRDSGMSGADTATISVPVTEARDG
ncbi:MAG: hypothetical protein LUE19_02635, partial [Clostridiales bacterium]|nr:hypothetical protein [Clostridiales bacterium]